MLILLNNVLKKEVSKVNRTLSLLSEFFRFIIYPDHFQLHILQRLVPILLEEKQNLKPDREHETDNSISHQTIIVIANQKQINATEVEICGTLL